MHRTPSDRAAWQAFAVRQLDAMLPHADPDGGCLPGPQRADYTLAGMRMEGVVRPLWAAVPLLSGGGTWAGWNRWLELIARGVDPANPCGWGGWGDWDQRHVEMGALGLLIAWRPDLLWEPYGPATRGHLATLLAQGDGRTIPDNNWRWFRVFAQLARRRVGIAWDPVAVAADLDRLESFARPDGWSRDGAAGPVDWYNGMALHLYALVYATVAHDHEPARAARFRERARLAGPELARWFAADGAALPIGRSLTYRWAQAAFWGACALADEPVLTWPELRGLWARHLRWWSGRPVWRPDGTPSVGYGYDQPAMAESYNAAGSPGWANKALLPLALPEGHLFWSAGEAAPPAARPRVAQPGPGFIVEDVADSVQALQSGQRVGFSLRHHGHKYAKFATSTAFAFGIATGIDALETLGADSALLLSEDGRGWRHPSAPEPAGLDRDGLHRRWRPWDDVRVDTWLLPAGAWHLRLHRIASARPLCSAEGGWPIDRDRAKPGDGASAAGPAGCSAIRDLHGGRRAQLLAEAPHQNLLSPRTWLPLLNGRHEPGTSWLACLVLGWPADPAAAPPEPTVALHIDGDRAEVRLTADGATRNMRLAADAAP